MAQIPRVRIVGEHDHSPIARVLAATPPIQHSRVESIRLQMPLWRYAGALRRRGPVFLLDSANRDAAQSRFTFLAGAPRISYRWHRGHARLEVLGRIPEAFEAASEDPFDDLRQLHRRLCDRPVEIEIEGERVPFTHGAVGYFGYEAALAIEALPTPPDNAPKHPDIFIAFTDRLLIEHAPTGRAFISVTGRGHSDAEAAADSEAILRSALDDLETFEATPERLRPSDVGRAAVSGPAPTGREVDARGQEYRSMVTRAREHIVEGDAFEVCVSQQLECDVEADPFAVYAHLRASNPAPFAAFIEIPGLAIASSSPERFLKLDAEGRVESRPIKGTAQRGRDREEDEVLRRALESSEKDRAENLMIVDLVRNDLGRVCKVGSVEVPELLCVESYATVFQLVSTVRGELRSDRDAFDLIRACFPAGSMTGAPKIEAMKIISSLERRARGVYAGAIGYLDASGAMDLSVVIRTIVMSGGKATWSSGGAVVADSDPSAELAESWHKVEALRGTLERFGGVVR